MAHGSARPLLAEADMRFVGQVFGF